MRGRGRWVVAVAAAVALAAIGTAAVAATAKHDSGVAKKPIIIGAAIDLTKNMAPFDAPAIAAAQIEIKKINAAGGVLGRKFQLKVINDQLDPNRTKQAAVQLLGQGADILWVTCDVDYASPIDERQAPELSARIDAFWQACEELGPRVAALQGQAAGFVRAAHQVLHEEQFVEEHGREKQAAAIDFPTRLKTA